MFQLIDNILKDDSFKTLIDNILSNMAVTNIISAHLTASI